MGSEQTQAAYRGIQSAGSAGGGPGAEDGTSDRTGVPCPPGTGQPLEKGAAGTASGGVWPQAGTGSRCAGSAKRATGAEGGELTRYLELLRKVRATGDSAGQTAMIERKHPHWRVRCQSALLGVDRERVYRADRG